MKKRLNQRQQKFAEFMASSGNQTESAIMAGYSPKRAHVTGSELVRNRNVSEEIIRSRGKIEEELGIDPLWCAENMWNFLRIQKKGTIQLPEDVWIPRQS